MAGVGSGSFLAEAVTAEGSFAGRSKGLLGLGPLLAPGFKGSREASGFQSRHFYSALKAFQGGSAIPWGPALMVSFIDSTLVIDG